MVVTVAQDQATNTPKYTQTQSNITIEGNL